MLRNYLKIAFRNLLRNKVYSFINIGGLAVGLAACLLIMLFVADELAYDQFNQKANRIYRLNTEVKFGGTEMFSGQSSDLFGPVLKKDYPSLENYVRLLDAGAYLVKKTNETNNLRETKMLFADSTIFDVFTFPLLVGNTKTALKEPQTMVISQSAAKRYFKTQNPIGQTLTLDNKSDYRITAIMQDIPNNSYIKVDFLMSLNSLKNEGGSYLSNNFQTFLLLRPDANPKDFEGYFNQIIQKNVAAELYKMTGSTIKEFEKSGSYYKISMIPLLDIHLKSRYSNELGTKGDIRYVYIFSVVAMFILLIACINFMNLSTARSSKRAKEVGIRKVLGTGRFQLMIQFFAECVLLSVFALVLALVIIDLAMPFFNDLTGKNISILRLLQGKFLIVLALSPLFLGFVAGSYPALFLSSFKPLTALKSHQNPKSLGRNSLVVFQFVTSIVLIISTIMVYRQINFIQQKNLGFNKNQVLIINDAYALDKKATAFKEEILKLKGVENGSLSGFLPTPSNRNEGAMWPEGNLDMDKGVQSGQWDIDYDYLKTFGMEIAKGRNFSKDFRTDSSGVILNEAAVKLFGFKNPINKDVSRYKMQNDRTRKIETYQVIGVVKDFHFESLKSNIGALCLFLNPNRGNVSFRLDAKSDMANTIKNIEAKWHIMAPGQPFSYTFMDESFDSVYKTEQRVGKIALVFALLTILVACLGLFGLITFMAEQRSKEIGIRKVLGASVASITTLLSKDLLKLVVIAIVISSPIAYYFMNSWLQDFAYRIAMEWWVFVLAGLAAVFIAMLTVSYQAIKAALMNPIKSLKTE